MAKHRVTVNKLKLTYKGVDYDYVNIVSPAPIASQLSFWENAFTDTNTNRNYYGTATYGGNPDLFGEFQSAHGNGTLNIAPQFLSLANHETMYFWREDIGREIRLVFESRVSSADWFAYFYGNTTQGGRARTVPDLATDSPNCGLGTFCVGFGYDDVTNRYIVYNQSIGGNNIAFPDNSAQMECALAGCYNAQIDTVLKVLLTGNTPPIPKPSTDPYADGGYSTGTDTGTGTFDPTSESVALPTTYSMFATASGIMSQYVMSEANLAAFGNWLWNGGSVFDDLKHFFSSPMDAIFSLGMLPFTPSDTTNYHVYVGSLDAGVTGGLVGDTVEKIDCGTIDFDGYYGSALDFNPYTKIEIFLPYCGNFALNPDEVMGHTIGVKYYCDTVSGDCVAFIYDEERVLYQVKGNCFIQIPLAARDFTAQYASAIGVVGTVAAGLAASLASGGLTAPVAVGMGTSMAANAMNAKAHVARAGGVSGMAGFMAIQTPYVIMTIPNQCLPELQADHQGYPLFVTKALKEFSGFTKVYEIHLDGLDCTDAEAKEIYDLLKGGVIL